MGGKRSKRGDMGGDSAAKWIRGGVGVGYIHIYTRPRLSIDGGVIRQAHH